MPHRKHKRNLHLMIIFFSISWIACIVFALLFIRATFQNAQYRHLSDTMKSSFAALESETVEFEHTESDKERNENASIKYMEWQFVLRDQVDQAKKLLQNEANKMKDIKNNKQVLGLLYYNLGLADTLALNFGEAINDFENAVRVNPKDADSMYNLGLLYSTFNNDSKAAVKYYKMYLEIAPSGAKAGEVKDRIAQLQALKQ